MSNLTNRQQKIQEKRKKTPRRQFVMEICSWHSFDFYRNSGKVSRYPSTGREGNLIDTPDQYNLNISGKEYTGNFVSDYTKLWLETPKGYLLKFFGDENCEFADAVFGAKNGYLSFEIGFDTTNVLYSFLIFSNAHNVISSVMCGDNSHILYQSLSITNSNKVFYSRDINNSSNIWFSNNLIGCEECLFCEDLENVKHCINNIVLEADDYFLKKKALLSQKNKFRERYAQQQIKTNTVKFSEDIGVASWSKYIHRGNNIIYAVGGSLGSNNMYDSIDIGINSSDFYASSAAGNNSSHLYSSSQINTCSNIYHSYHLDNCSFCLGCIGLKNKSYCILNKQYTKEERHEKVDEIFVQMEKTPHPDPLLAGEGENALGAFFPATMNPFYFNDTAAYLIDPSFTKEEVTAKGYLRRDDPIKVDIPAGVQTVKTSELGQYEARRPHPSPLPKEEGDSPVSQRGEPEEGQHRRIDPEIMKKVILDEEGNAYRIIPMEYEFLMKHGLPLPRKHRLERMKENFRIS